MLRSKPLLRLKACLIISLTTVLACSGPKQGSDAGQPTQVDGGVDAGTTMNDAGLILADDAGLPPSEPVITLQVSANPNSVLSAIATVGWTGPITSVRVIYAMSGFPNETTPSYQVDDSKNPVAVPVLGLKASVDYSMIAVATDSAGGQFYSSPVGFRTGPLPAGFPVFNVASTGAASAGYTVLGVLPVGGAPLPEYMTIVDGAGEPVWYVGVSPPLGGDFQKQPDHTYTIAVDDPTSHIPGISESLTVFQQVDVLGNTVKTWRAQDFVDPVDGSTVHIAATDDHEIRIQPNGDALLFGLIQQTADLTAQGGKSNANLVGDVLERETPSGDITFAWSVFDHLQPANIDPVSTPTNVPVIDYTHANSIDVSSDGNYIIGLRNFSQIIKIDSIDGHIIWKLGGKDGQFTFLNDPLGGFSCQHGARETPDGHIILFDDGNGHRPLQSRAVEYALDTDAMTATLVWSAEDSPPLFSYVLGFAQHLAGGNSLVTFGTAMHVQEFNPTGKVVWDLTDAGPLFGFYRAYRIDSLY